MYELQDGRLLMASYEDIEQFFAEHNIVGKTIDDIIPFCHDYMIYNISEVNDFINRRTQSLIQTDGCICLIFTDGSNLEIEFCGDGPIILGYNTAKLETYPKYDGTCYTLHTMFQYALGHMIVGIYFEKTDKRMQFPIYCGLDMSSEDEGIKEIRIALNGGTTLMASGALDSFCFEHFMDFGGPVEVKYAELISELNRETYLLHFGDWIRENEERIYEEDSWELFSAVDVFYDDLDGVEYGQYGFKNAKGEIVIEPQYWCCLGFSHGLAAVAWKGPSVRYGNGRVYNQELWGYIDKTGKIVIPVRFGRVSPFNKYGVAVVQDTWNDYDDYYLIDTTGKEIPGTRCRYLIDYYDYDERFLEFSNVDEGGCNNLGLYDTKERRVVVPPRTGGVTAWDENNIEVSETGAYGYSDRCVHHINVKGEELYPDLVGKGFSVPKKANLNGHVIVSKTQFYRVDDNVTSWNTIFGKKYRSTNLYGVVDVKGNILIPIQYENITDNKDGTFECSINGEHEVISISK